MSWPLTPLGEIVTIKGGGTPSKSQESYWGGEIPWASVKDLKGSTLSTTQDSITELGVKNSATNVIPAGTILTATRMALGKFAINSVDMAINQDLKALFINDHLAVDRGYLFRFLESKAQFIDGEGKGATVKGITLDFLKSIQIPLPPLDEQKRIAAILDKADAIRRKRQQAIQLADDLLRSVFLEMFGDPISNPKGWKTKKLGDLVEIKGGGTPSKKEESYWGGNIPWASVKDIKGKSLDSTIDFINQSGVDNSATNVIPQGTIITPTRMALGKFVLNSIDVAINQDLKALFIKPDMAIEQTFLLDFLQSLQAYIEGEGKGATVKGITLDFLKGINISVPPLALQKKYENLRKRLSLIQHNANSALSSCEDSFYSLSQKAFAGEL